MRLLLCVVAIVAVALALGLSAAWAEGDHRPIPYPVDGDHIGVGNQGVRGQRDITHPTLPSAEGVNIRYRLVSVVYFYPSDQEPHLEYVAQIDPAVDQMQDWYGALVGTTFGTTSVKVMRGQQDTATYQADIWDTILRELSYYCGTGVHLVIIHDSISPNYGGGGSCSGDGGGTALVSERWLGSGVVPHELGHAFTLPHPKRCGSQSEPAYCAETVMWSWWFYPDVGLLDYEIKVLQSHVAFTGGDDPTFCKPFKGRGKALGRCR